MTDFRNYFTVTLSGQFSIKRSLNISLHPIASVIFLTHESQWIYWSVALFFRDSRAYSTGDRVSLSDSWEAANRCIRIWIWDQRDFNG